MKMTPLGVLVAFVAAVTLMVDVPVTVNDQLSDGINKQFSKQFHQ
jgi:hypothetical protein